MSLFGGFGQQQNNQQQPQNTGFGGFGSNNTTGSGFGQPANTGFGSTPSNAGGSLFGSNTNTGFGSGATTGPGFGSSNTASPFGANRTGFGNTTATTSGGGLFGSNSTAAPTSTGFGGFGSNANSGGSIFGAANKPAFGAQNNAGGSLFGAGSSTTTFGQPQNQATSGFGNALGSALGTNTAECQGTGSTQFQPFTEKDGTATSSVTNHFQSISFMQPYRNFSFEELRLADYNQGRRFGNGSGQAGAFGFSGFGGQQSGTTTNPFGTQATSTSSSFGGGQTNNTFGNTNTSGGLFGQANKPSGGSLFGMNNTSSSQPAGGPFSTNNSSNTGFGGFGGQQQEQPKTGFSFGNNANTGTGFGTGGTGFGASSTSNTGGGLFGNSQNTPAFGSGQQQQPQQNSNSFGGFGSNQQNQNQSSSSAGFGGFGQNNQQKPGGLFGNNTTANTGGGLFGSNQTTQQQQPSSGLFGNNNQQQQQSGGSLFGKPQGSGGGLFGNNASTATNNTGGGLFGNTLGNNNANQNQQNQGGGLFGNNNQQQQKPGGLFGNAGSTGGNLFGNSGTTQQQPAGGSLFGSAASTNNQQQQQQPGGLFGNSTNNNSGFLGMSQQQPNALAQPQTLQASILDKYPFGSASIFDGLPPPPQPTPPPMATPINRGSTVKKSVIPPNYKISPAQSQSRLLTPRRNMAFGFSYSTYGTPSSVGSNVSTPGAFGGSLLHSSISRGLGKSLSTSNLRRSFDSDGESLLSPGAFSAGSSRYSGVGSMKKLQIDRSLRTDLFGNGGPAALSSPDKADQSKQPGILKKKVSFDTNTVGGKEDSQDGRSANDTVSRDTVNSAQPSAQEQGFLRSTSRGNSKYATPKTNGVSSQSEMEQLKGNELAIVHEDGSPETATSSNDRPLGRIPQTDPEPGGYYMRPSRAEIDQMSPQQRSNVVNFEVGRQNCGRVVFNQPVDLNNVELDDIFGKIAVIIHRSITVYPDTEYKPPVGQGLNVPSTLYLENSWPRQRDHKTPLYEKSGPRFNRHVDRLRKVKETEFVEYQKDTGIWVFKVPHFTTYEFDYDDTASEGESLHVSTMSNTSADVGTPTPKSRPVQNGTGSSKLDSLQSSTASTDPPSNVSSSPYDTFEFRKRKILPGAFDGSAAIYDDANMEDAEQNTESFLEDGLAVTPSEDDLDEPSELHDGVSAMEDSSLIIQDEEMQMVGSFPQQDAKELESTMGNDTAMPRSILKHSRPDSIGPGTPKQLDLSSSGDWADELQKTISPRKQDRQALRESQANILQSYQREGEEQPKVRLSETGVGKELRTSIDLMNSLYGKDLARKGRISAKRSSQGKGFEWPYSKRPKIDESDMNEQERSFHGSYKPCWGPESVVLYSKPSQMAQTEGQPSHSSRALLKQRDSISSEGREIAVAKLIAASDIVPEILRKQRNCTTFKLDAGVPFAETQLVPLKEFGSGIPNDLQREQDVWELASVLFDKLDLKAYTGLPRKKAASFEHRLRKDDLSRFWQKICKDAARDACAAASNVEERAIAHLTANKISEACEALLQGKDYRLAVLVAQLGDDGSNHEDIASQIEEWRKQNMLSEMTEPVRALYELLAGNTCKCEGKRGPLEDRARTFVISERFALDWERAFGLRLWYAIGPEDPLEVAVQKFTEDLESGEIKKPLSGFVDEKASQEPQDGTPESGEHILWGLLKLYACSKAGVSAPSLANIVDPMNTIGHPLGSRLSFQLYHLLALHFPQSDRTKADQITWDFATQLESTGDWMWALFVILHLSNPQQRQFAIQSLLAHHASDINDGAFTTLTTEFQIPAPWIWEAKALLSRSQEDAVGEVEHLLRAENWTEAHSVLCRTVGPQAVIEQDYATLQELLERFDGRNEVEEWGVGGQIYEDFAALVVRNGVGGGLERKAKAEVLGHLLEALPAMGEREDVGFEERVAIQEMSAVVAKAALEGAEKGIKKARILDLPLTQEARLESSLQLSVAHYRAIMAGGK